MNLSDFHFLRPEWFLALLPLALLFWLLWRKRLLSRSWQAVVDARLLPHLLIGNSAARTSRWPLLLLALGALLTVTALAGPVWQKLEQPVFRQQSGLVVLLDLSRSMDATDVRPSRLARARLKLIDILHKRREGQTALVTYAAEPFVVTPLTNDTKTIISQVPSMTTDLMPVQGSRPDRAIAMARHLLQQAGIAHGSVLLITDGVDGVEPQALKDEIKQLTDAGDRLLVMGVGTRTGAPIPRYKSGGFVTDSSGAIVIPKLDEAALAAVAKEGNGLYRHMTTDDSDINALLAQVDADNRNQRAKKVAEMMNDQWQEAGVWLLLPLLLLGALAFRRGYIAAVVLALVILPQPRPAYAFDWASLWSNRDQQAQQALEKGDAARAEQLFSQPQWRAAAQYRNGEYQKSLKSLQGSDSADSYYNRGNAQAKLGHFPEAIKAYDEALKRNPKMKDAKDNRDLIKKLMEQQQQKNQKQKSQQDKNGKQGDNSQQQQGGQGKSQQQQNSQKQQQQSGSQSQQKSGSGGKESDQQQKGRESQQQQQRDAGNSGRQQEQNRQRAGQQGQQEQLQQQQQDQRQKEQQAAAQQQKEEQGQQDQKQAAAQAQQLSPQQREEQRANEQWLQRIPDDPGGLWRRKFLYQYQRQQQKQGDEEKAW